MTDEQRQQFERICEEGCEYIKSIYSKIVFYPEELEVEYKIHEFVHFYISGNKKDDGVLIGRKGATINSLRLFVHAFAKAKMGGAPCVVEVKDHLKSRHNPINFTRLFSNRSR